MTMNETDIKWIKRGMEKLQETSNKNLEQSIKTNGRVNALEHETEEHKKLHKQHAKAINNIEKTLIKYIAILSTIYFILTAGGGILIINNIKMYLKEEVRVSVSEEIENLEFNITQ